MMDTSLPVSMIVELTLVLLLVATLICCFSLERRLKNLRKDQDSLNGTVRALNGAIVTASASIARLRAAAEELWPAVAATEDFAYRTLAMCWVCEQHAEGTAAETTWSRTELERFCRVTGSLAGAVRTGTQPPDLDPMPVHGFAELALVRDSLHPVND